MIYGNLYYSMSKAEIVGVTNFWQLSRKIGWDSLDLRHLVKVISKVLWCKSILTAVRQYRQPKRDSFRDSQPVMVVQQRRHVVEFPGSVDQTHRSVQDRLSLSS